MSGVCREPGKKTYGAACPEGFVTRVLELPKRAEFPVQTGHCAQLVAKVFACINDILRRRSNKHRVALPPHGFEHRRSGVPPPPLGPASAVPGTNSRSRPASSRWKNSRCCASEKNSR